MAKLEARVTELRMPKAGLNDSQCEDASKVDGDLAVVADGASTTFESRKWARLLVDAFAADPLFNCQQDEILSWIDVVAADWVRSIGTHSLDYFQEEKSRLGSAATLLGVRFDIANSEWQLIAIGDCCMFRVSGGELVSSVPISRSVDFNIHPALFSTRREINERNLKQKLVIQRVGSLAAGDEFYLLTDALASWFLRHYENGGLPWEALAKITDRSTLEAFVGRLRSAGQIRDDDVTLVRVSFAPAEASAGSLAGLGGGPEAAQRRTGTTRRADRPSQVGASTGPGRGQHLRPGGADRTVKRSQSTARGDGPAVRVTGPIGAEPVARGADQTHMVSWAWAHRRRLTIAIIMLALLIGGFTVGRLSSHASTLQVVHGGNSRKLTTLESEARAIVDAIGTFHSGESMADYEASLAHMPGGPISSQIASALPAQFGLTSTPDTSGFPRLAFSSSVALISLTASMSRSGGVADVLARQSIPADSAYHTKSESRDLVFRLEMTRPGRHWVLAAVSFYAPSKLLPVQPQASGSHKSGTKTSTKNGAVK
jgi:Protein phosphatase 2C